MILEPKSAPQHVWSLWSQFGPRSANIFFPRPCRRLDRWDTKAIRLGSAFLAGAFVFWEKHDLEKSCPKCPGSPTWSRKKHVYTSGDQIRVRWPNMLRGRFWHENQDFEVSVGAICIIFRDLSVPTGPGTQNRLFEKSNRRIGWCCEGVNPPTRPESWVLPRGGVNPPGPKP